MRERNAWDDLPPYTRKLIEREAGKPWGARPWAYLTEEQEGEVLALGEAENNAKW